MPVLTEAQWSAIEPLIEAVRPQTGRELTNLRRTFEAMVWRMHNGAKWRAIPAELGPWWMAAQTFIRCSKLGVWERFFEAAKAAGRPQLGMVFMDGTIIRAHQKAAGATTKGSEEAKLSSPVNEALGRSQGGFGTKAHALADARGRALGFALTPGQAGEAPQSLDLLAFLPAIPGWVLADRGYSSHAVRSAVWELGSRPAIPTRRNEAPVRCPDWIDVNRERIERMWNRLKEWRAIATRYEKTARSFLSALHLAAAFDWLKP